MSTTYRIVEQVIGGGRAETNSRSVTAAAHTQIDETIAASATDTEVAAEVDVSELKAVFIESDQNVTLETNSAGTPDDTLSLLADRPYIWDENAYNSCLLTTDITALFFSNAGDADANVTLFFLYDPTP